MTILLVLVGIFHQSKDAHQNSLKELSLAPSWFNHVQILLLADLWEWNFEIPPSVKGGTWLSKGWQRWHPLLFTFVVMVGSWLDIQSKYEYFKESKWWYKQRWSLKMITINMKRYDNWLLPECVWYGEVLCDGAVIIVSLKKKTNNLKNSKHNFKDILQ